MFKLVSSWTVQAEQKYDVETQTNSKQVGSSHCTSRYNCVNCTTVRVCLDNDENGFVETRRFNCSGVTPNCDPKSGTCTSKPTPNCATQGDFKCLAKNGFFPDLTTCNAFHVCRDYKALSFSCGRHLTYDSTTEQCRENFSCFNFNCSGKHGLKVEYSGDPKFFTYCAEGSPIAVDICQENQELNPSSQRCEVVCKREGLIQSNKHCQEYYKCTAVPVESQIIYAKTKMRCPTGEAFSPFEFQCVPEELVDGCNPKEITTSIPL